MALQKHKEKNAGGSKQHVYIVVQDSKSLENGMGLYAVEGVWPEDGIPQAKTGEF